MANERYVYPSFVFHHPSFCGAHKGNLSLSGTCFPGKQTKVFVSFPPELIWVWIGNDSFSFHRLCRGANLVHHRHPRTWAEVSDCAYLAHAPSLPVVDQELRQPPQHRAQSDICHQIGNLDRTYMTPWTWWRRSLRAWQNDCHGLQRSPPPFGPFPTSRAIGTFLQQREGTRMYVQDDQGLVAHSAPRPVVKPQTSATVARTTVRWWPCP